MGIQVLDQAAFLGSAFDVVHPKDMFMLKVTSDGPPFGLRRHLHGEPHSSPKQLSLNGHSIWIRRLRESTLPHFGIRLISMSLHP